MLIDWGAFFLVFAVSFVAAVGVVLFYTLGIRLLSIGSADDTGADGSVVSGTRGRRPFIATAGGYLCFAIGIAAVLYGLWLLIPQFH